MPRNTVCYRWDLGKKHNSSAEQENRYPFPRFYISSVSDREGFEEGKAPCYLSEVVDGMKTWGGNDWMDQYTLCHNSSLYVFFDGMHTTERANSQLAELMWDGPSSTTQPWTLKQFFEL